MWMMTALREFELFCARMGAFKPRTRPYLFQGHGRECLQYVVELAGRYGIRVISGTSRSLGQPMSSGSKLPAGWAAIYSGETAGGPEDEHAVGMQRCRFRNS